MGCGGVAGRQKDDTRDGEGGVKKDHEARGNGGDGIVGCTGVA